MRLSRIRKTGSSHPVITAATLGVLLVFVVHVLGLTVLSPLVAAMTLVLVLAMLFMPKQTPSSSPTVPDSVAERYTSQLKPVTAVSNSSGIPLLGKWSNPMEPFTSDEMNETEEALLDEDDVEFLLDRVMDYIERNDDMSQREWAYAQSLREKLETWL